MVIISMEQALLILSELREGSATFMSVVAYGRTEIIEHNVAAFRYTDKKWRNEES